MNSGKAVKWSMNRGRAVSVLLLHFALLMCCGAAVLLPAGALAAEATAKPEIKSVGPETISASPSEQELTLTLAGVKDGDEVTADFTGPKGGAPIEKKSKVASSAVKVSLVLNEVGKWSVTVKNGSDSSSAREFQVKEASAKEDAKGTCHPQPDAPEVKAFRKIFRVMNDVLLSLFLALGLGLVIATFKGWSLGDALAEESSEQPAVINDRSSVIMVASASRIVAVVGLFGILALVIGIGYSIVWNLTVCGTAPNLAGIKDFLLAIAALFTPYLANQIREAVSPSNPPKAPAPVGASSVAISGVAQRPLTAAFAPRQLDFTGSGFQDGLKLNLIDPSGGVNAVPATNTTVATATDLRVTNVALDRGGAWKAVVIGPGGDSSDAFVFAVTAPAPTVNAIAAFPAAQGNVVITGQNFLPATTVTLQNPAGQNVTANAIVQDGQNVRITAAFVAGNNWSVTAKNPGNNAAATQTFNVS
ncbi:MAG: hypothetical protein WB729_19000 [Candidatus Sulfotelmatobacter sp.]